MLVGLEPDQLEVELRACDAPEEVSFPVGDDVEIIGDGIEIAASRVERLRFFAMAFIYVGVVPGSATSFVRTVPANAGGGPPRI